MTRVRKITLAVLAVLLAVCLGVGLASCGAADEEKKAELIYGYGEEGTYYCAVTDDTEYMLTLNRGTVMLAMPDASYVTGEYSYDGVTFSYSLGGSATAEGSVTEEAVTLSYGGTSYTFLRYEYYTVTFTDGSTTITTQSVLNGKAAQDPGELDKDGYAFLGWYADAAFTVRYEFSASVTADITVYARFVEISGVTEYKVTFDYTGETADTINGIVYDLPTLEKSGYTFLGWWVSATNNADELTYKYDGEELYEDTTLFAVFVSGSYIGASVKDGVLYWENSPASQMAITVTDENGSTYSYEAQATNSSFAVSALFDTGKYTVAVSCGGVTEILTYVSNGLSRVSNFTVSSGSVLVYGAVANAERYYISVECGNPAHDHTAVDNGTSIYYDFSNCEMGADGITFTVYAVADGWYYSVSSYNYFLGLGSVVVTVSADTVLWDGVTDAQEYEIYINGSLVTTTSGTSYSLADYGAGTYEIAIRPVAKGYYSETSIPYVYEKTTLAAPSITGIENRVVIWTEVDGATGYIVKIGDVETTVGSGITSLYITDDSYADGLGVYGISVKAMAADSANDSPYGDTVYVTGSEVGSTVTYDDGTVTWQYSLKAAEYRITVNDGDELVVAGTNSSPVTLTKSGYNEIAIYFVDGDGATFGAAYTTVYAYAIILDARGGSVTLNGDEVMVMYIAKGDTLNLPTPDYVSGSAEFMGWYTLPDLTDDPDADSYAGDGVLFENGTAFMGSSTTVLYAFWINQRLTIALDPGMGTLVDDGGEAVGSALIPVNGVRYVLDVPVCDDSAYVFMGWYSGENGTGTRYTYEDGSACAVFDDTSVTTLYAFWAQIFAFSTTSYNGQTVLSVSKGSDIGLVSEVTIPETYIYNGEEWVVEVISSSTAFSGCTNLKTINIPDTVIYINVSGNGYDSGYGAFSGTALESVNVYETGEEHNLTREIVYYSADGVLFWINDNTGDVELLYYPYGRTDESYAVPVTVENANEYEIDGLGEKHVVRTVNAIGARAFSDHDALVSVVIPENITTIGSYAFYRCDGLEYVELAGEVENLEMYTFAYCTSLITVDLPDTLKSLQDGVFCYDTALKTMTIPESVTYMGWSIFEGDYRLESVQLSSYLTALDDYTFYDCEALKGIELPYGLTSIGRSVFYNCYSLQSITIPAGVSSIGNNAFNGCYKLVEVYNLSSLNITAGSSDNGYVGYYAKYVYTANSGSTGSHIFTDNGFQFIYDTDNKYYLIGYAGTETDIVLPEAIDGCAYDINGYAFKDMKDITSVVIPETVTQIGEYAFYGCNSLESVNIPAGVTVIEQYTFYDCTSLKEIIIPDGVTSIGNYAFFNCQSLETASVPDSVTSIGSRAFQQCYALKSINIPEGVTQIGDRVFYQCYSLIEVVIPDSVTTISSWAFEYCRSLVRVTLGTGLQSIGSEAFLGCYKLCEVCNLSSLDLTIGNSSNGYVSYYAKNVCFSESESHIVNLGDFMFVYDDRDEYFLVAYYGDESAIELPDKIDGRVYSVTKYAFYENETLTSVTIPDSVTAIGENAFQNCTNIEYVAFGNGLTEIGEYAFYGCSSLAYANIGAGIRQIGDYAFYRCTSLVSVYVGDGLESVGMYAFAYCSALRAISLPEGLTSVGDYCFYNCSSLANVTFPSTITSLGGYVCNGTAYYDDSANWTNGVLYLANYLLDARTSCSGTVVVKDGTTIISGYAFNGCTAVTSIVLPDSVTDIGDYAFSGCTSLLSVNIPDGVTKISTGLLNGCSALATITIGSSVTEIDNSAFYGCKGLLSIVIPEGVTSIGSSAFYNCSALIYVFVPSTLVEVGSNAFYNCTAIEGLYISDLAAWCAISFANYDANPLKNATNLYLDSKLVTDLVIPEGVTEISYYTFYKWETLKSVTLPEGFEAIGGYAFWGCTSLTEVTLPESLKEVGELAFYNCSGLDGVVLPGGVDTIGASAFYGCSSLTSINIPDGVTTIQSQTFYGCSSLTEIVIGSGVTRVESNAFRNCSSLTTVYYNGTADGWNGITVVNTNNTSLTNAVRYYYSETEPIEDGNWWHWVDGEVVIWKKD